MNFPRPEFEAKLCPPELLAKRAAGLAKRLVFTNGCFDILHRGHATYLAQARALGASLVVAVNSDESVRRLGKGAGRPVNCLTDRMALLAALESVSLVTSFDEDTPLQAILRCQPDVLVKGGDWPPEKIIGAPETLAHGGQVFSIPFVHPHSTSKIVDTIRRL